MSTQDPRADVEADLRRVADRLRGAPELRVEAASAAARAVLQLIADTAAGVDGRAAGDPPAPRAVPELPISALGDQLAVLGLDLVMAARDVADDEPVWIGGTRTPLATGLATVAAELRTLRLAL